MDGLLQLMFSQENICEQYTSGRACTHQSTTSLPHRMAVEKGGGAWLSAVLLSFSTNGHLSRETGGDGEIWAKCTANSERDFSKWLLKS